MRKKKFSTILLPCGFLFFVSCFSSNLDIPNNQKIGEQNLIQKQNFIQEQMRKEANANLDNSQIMESDSVSISEIEKINWE